MAIHIYSGKNTLNCSTVEANIQLMPFKIHADCDAKITKYFDSQIESRPDGSFSASFRGYPLKGMKITVPDGYRGIVLHESIHCNERSERKLFGIHEFNSFTYWNWDKKPSKNDALVQVLDWIDIAETLHSPIVD